MNERAGRTRVVPEPPPPGAQLRWPLGQGHTPLPLSLECAANYRERHAAGGSWGYARGMRPWGALLLLLLGCSSTNSEPEPGASNGGAGPSPSSAGGSCVGTPKNGYDMQDIQSCGAQRGDWSTVFATCSGGASSNSCTTTIDRIGCLDLDGCSWRVGDNEERAQWANGTCTGAPIACETFDEAGCRANSSWCRKDDYSNCREVAFRPFGSSCAELDQASKSPYHHTRIVREACAVRPGCTWTNGDGTPYTR